MLGPETADSSGLDLIGETRDVVVTSKKIAGHTIGELRATIDPTAQRGVFVSSLTRLNQPLPLAANTKVAIGDVARVSGVRPDVEHATKLIGYPTPPADKTDFLYFGLGLASGFALGLLGVRFRGSLLGLGTGGGCLIAGLFFGWLRARRPTFGQLPAAAALYLKDFGLAVFVACIGLATGPEALQTNRPIRRGASCCRYCGRPGARSLLSLLRKVRIEDAPGHPYRCVMRPAGEHARHQRRNSCCWEQCSGSGIHRALHHRQHIADIGRADHRADRTRVVPMIFLWWSVARTSLAAKAKVRA